MLALSFLDKLTKIKGEQCTVPFCATLLPISLCKLVVIAIQFKPIGTFQLAPYITKEIASAPACINESFKHVRVAQSRQPVL